MELIKRLKLLEQSKISEVIRKRIKEFEKTGRSSPEKIFSELCFCILTANFSAERGIKIQRELENEFLIANEKRLAKMLKNLGYRYPNTRARYIVEARKKLSELMKILRDKTKNEPEIREWLVKNVKGLGYKEASHFLRNIGFKNIAVIDFHVLDVLEKYRLAEKPGALTRKKYLEIENVLRGLAERLSISLAELDLYLWYMETGKVLK